MLKSHELLTVFYNYKYQKKGNLPKNFQASYVFIGTQIEKNF